MTFSSHLSMMWTVWRIIFAVKVVYFPSIDKSENVLFLSYINDKLEREGRRKDIEISTMFSALKKAIRHLFLTSTLQYKCYLYYTNEILLMLGKKKYFPYISSKWKNKGHDLNSDCCALKPIFFPLRHTSPKFVFTWRGVNWLVLAFLRPSQHQTGMSSYCWLGNTHRSSPKQAIC